MLLQGIKSLSSSGVRRAGSAQLYHHLPGVLSSEEAEEGVRACKDRRT